MAAMTKKVKETTPTVSDDPSQLSPEAKYEALKKVVNAKLQDAADAIREAATLAKAGGFPLKRDPYDGSDNGFDNKYEGARFDTYCIERAMGASGWNTSSWHC